MRQDKKVERGRLTFILARGIGESFIARDVEEASVLAIPDQGPRACPGWRARAALTFRHAKIALMPISLDVLVIVVSIVAAAFFAGAETALTAASRARMHALEMSGDKRAKLVNRLIGMRGRLISAMLLGGQFVTIGSSAIATSVMLDLYGDRGVWAATIVMTTLIVVFGEVMPKTIAIAYPDRVSLFIAPLVLFFVTVFGPIVSAVEALVRGFLRLCGVSLIETDPGVTGHEELMGAVDILHREGGVEREERDMFGGLLELAEIPVSDIMMHRTKMRLIDADLPPEELVREVIDSPYTRMPLWRGEPDNIVGVLHAKDLLARLCRGGRRRGKTQHRRTDAGAVVHSRNRRRCATSCRLS